jgi:hypothetical protein
MIRDEATNQVRNVNLRRAATRIGRRRGILAGLLLLLAACASGLAIVVALAGASVTSFGGEGERAGQLKSPNGVAIDASNGDVYVADQNNNRIDKFDRSGNFLLAWGYGVRNGGNELQTCTVATSCRVGLAGSAAGQVERPAGVAVDSSSGDVYVFDKDHVRVEKFEAAGSFTGVEFKAGSFTGGSFVAVGPGGNVYVGGNGAVEVFSPTGVPKSTIPISGAGGVSGLAVDAGGDLYITAVGLSGVGKYKPDGTGPLYKVDAAGEPAELTLDAAGNLYVADVSGYFSSPKQPVRYLEYGPTGAQLESFGSPDFGSAVYTYGIAFSNIANALYVTEYAINGVLIIAPPPPGPLLRLGSEVATNVRPTKATLCAILNPEGHETTYHFEYVDAVHYNPSAPNPYGAGHVTPPGTIAAGFNDETPCAPVTGLTGDTTYHFRIVASDSVGNPATPTPPDATFVTPPPVVIDGEWSTEVGATSAKINASVNPEELVTKYHFEYVDAAHYEPSAPNPYSAGAVTAEGTIAAGIVTDQTVDAPLSGLQPNTIYHYRLVGHNAGGEVPGADRTFTTFAPAAPFALPDGRAYEVVSPLEKNGADAEAGFLNRSAESGEALLYSSTFNAFEGSAGADFQNQYIARRGTGGWTTQPITPPISGASWLHVLSTGPQAANVWLAITPDLSTGMVENNDPPLASEAPAGQANLYVAGYSPGSIVYQTVTNVAPPNSPPSTLQVMPEFAGASADFSHVVFSEASNLTPEAPAEGHPQVSNVYEWTGGRLRLVNIDPNGTPLSGGAVAGAHFSLSGAEIENQTHVVSEGGSRIFFTALGNLALYMREGGTATTLISASHRTGANPTIPHEGIFQGASVDGSKVFFESAVKLTNDATPGYNLYRYDVATGLTDLTTGDPNGANVEPGGVVGSSEYGSYVYFVATGALAGENAEERSPSTGAPNLYVWHDGTVTFIATLDASLDKSDWRSNLGLTTRLTPDGRHLAFDSVKSLTGYDNTDANSGEPDSEVFVYEAGAGLSCMSCNPSGARPVGSSTLDRRASAQYMQRNLSADGSRLFFDSYDALVPGDTNGRQDVYEYENGHVHLISSGTGGENAVFLDASASGNDAFFATRQSLVPGDTDNLVDVYDARVGGGFPAALSQPQCSGTGCQGVPLAPPLFATPASVTFSGPGNFAAPAKSKAKPAKKKVKRKPKHKGKKKRARKGSLRRRGRSGRTG